MLFQHRQDILVILHIRFGNSPCYWICVVMYTWASLNKLMCACNQTFFMVWVSLATLVWVWRLHGKYSLHDLCRANQNQYSHASSRQKMVAMWYFVREIIISEATTKIDNNRIKPKLLHVVITYKTRSKRTRIRSFHFKLCWEWLRG